MLTPQFTDQYRTKKVPWDGLGYITYKRTYAREMSNGKTEEWVDTLTRCLNGAQTIGAQYTQDELERLFDHMFHLRAIYSGRMLWRLGVEGPLSKYGDSLNNCWSVAMDSIDSFCFLFEELMMGGGVGYSLRRQDINSLPKVKKNVTVKHDRVSDADFIVPDSREGWVKLLRNVLEAFLHTGDSFTYSTILVRGKGEPIKGFGGTASGPLVLVEGIEDIVGVLQSREGKKLRSIDILDVCNIIGSIVVAGNVRRSAQIALGDSDDILFLRAKRWDLGKIPNWRQYSNNTLYADSYDYLLPEFWDGYRGNGEPYGLFNLGLSQSQGRLTEKINDLCEMLNPCGEQTLESFECCNLAEIPLNNIRTYDELLEISKLLYKTQKAVAAMPYLYKQTQEVVHRNMRLGQSVTGIVQSLDKIVWLDDAYRSLRQYDKEWSKLRGWNESIKLTCVKPSGTVSLLTGSTPGIHPAFAPYYIRRVRMSSDSPLIALVKEFGYDVEYSRKFDGSIDYNTSIVSFPVQISGAIYAKDMSAIEQLDLVKVIQTTWADNAVSVTVYYKREEIPAIQQWLKTHYETSIKSVSFLLHSDHGFDQAPYEEITESMYANLASNVQEITPDKVSVYDEWLDGDCVGSCPIR